MTLCVDGNGACLPYSGQATLFNGPKADRVRLHVWVQSLGTTVISKGTISKIESGNSDYVGGARIEFPFGLPSYVAITDLELLIHHGGYVKAKCQSSDTTWNRRATFTYRNGTPDDRRTTSQGCFVS